jgi:hypothetical protein
MHSRSIVDLHISHINIESVAMERRQIIILLLLAYIHVSTKETHQCAILHSCATCYCHLFRSSRKVADIFVRF